MGTQKFHLDMICTHSDEGLLEVEELIEWVYRHFNCGATNLLTNIVIALNWNYNAEIASIRNDMWSRVTIKSHDAVGGNFNENGRYVAHLRDPLIIVSAECDYIEHGLAACYKFIVELHELSGKSKGAGEVF